MKDFDDRPSNTTCKYCGRGLGLFEMTAFKGKHCRECYLKRKRRQAFIWTLVSIALVAINLFFILK